MDDQRSPKQVSRRGAPQPARDVLRPAQLRPCAERYGLPVHDGTRSMSSSRCWPLALPREGERLCGDARAAAVDEAQAFRVTPMSLSQVRAKQQCVATS